MIKDILDVLNPKQRFTLTGKYFSERPDGPDVGGEEFNYEYVDPYTKTAIRTDDQLSFKEGIGMVVLQDGTAYLIHQKMTDYSAAPKQSCRVLPVPIGTEYVLRLTAIEEPWGVQ